MRGRKPQMPVEVPGHAAELGLEVPRRRGEPGRRRDHDDLAAAGPRIVADYRHRTGAFDDHHATASAPATGAGLIGSRDRQENDKERYAQHRPAVTCHQWLDGIGTAISPYTISGDGPLVAGWI